MIFEVRVNPRASCNRVERQGNKFKVYLTKPACEGAANKQLLDLLSAHLKIKKYQIKIKAGEKSRDKLVKIDAS